ncbi:DUF423 domain-containing protein [Robiginitalea sp.]|uniref:DUF423 domain-containing protein n=1 Tax=Robiginitalea sp. TaxID=1902411 RepID=UPI003C710B44
MNKAIVGAGTLFGMLAVILGAFGAHFLKVRLPEAALDSFRTGVMYLMYHALFLLILGGMDVLKVRAKRTVFYLIASGTFLFSFSIFALTTAPLAGLDLSSIGWVTPIGGLLLISGWTLFGYRVFRGLN